MVGKRNRNTRDSGWVGGQLTEANKRHKAGNSRKPKPTLAPVDPTYGQRAAFPGLDEPVDFSDNDVEHEDTHDALSYLKSVRQQAGAIPNLLTAHKVGPRFPPVFYRRGFYRSLYKDLDTGEDRAYYDDGAYIAAPQTESSANAHTPTDVWEIINRKVIEAYYESIIARFTAMRQTLHREPPEELVRALPAEHATYVEGFGSRSKVVAIWSRRMRNTDPRSVQIAAMSTKSVFKLIRILMKGKFMTRENGLRDRTSCWLWALLARLPDRGQLDHRDISWVRELGKRAVYLMADKAHAAALREQVQDDLDASDFEEEGGWGHDEELYMRQDEGEVVEGPSIGIKDGNQLDGTPDTTKITSEDRGGGDDDDEMDMDIDDGEVSSDDNQPPAEPTTMDLDEAKARLLAALGESSNLETTSVQDDEDEEDEPVDENETQRLHGTYATLTMILTVAGEFYGQRDLLEFRNPFPDA